VPIDLHRCGHGADSLATLVSYLDDNGAGIALRQPALANLSSRAGCPLHSGVQAVELGAIVIAQEVRTVMDIEMVAGHGILLMAGPCPLTAFDQSASRALEAPWLTVLSKALQQPQCHSSTTPEHLFKLICSAPSASILSGQGKQSMDVECAACGIKIGEGPPV
jgi:hypothetical protein